MKQSGLVLFGLLWLAAFSAQAQYTFNTNADGTINILRCTNAGNGMVTVPTTLGSGNSNVTTIGEFAFANISNLTNVTIPDAGFVADVGNFAFYLSTNLTNVSISANVTNIGSNVFADCYNLQSITVDAGNANYSSISGILYDKNLITLLQFPEAYSGSLSIPGSVTSLGSYAFAFCQGLTSVTIPSSVTNLGQFAFDSCINLTSVVIGNGVTNIGADAFFDCTSLSSVTIGAGVTNLGAAAFAGCTNLASITVSPSNAYYSSIGGVLFNESQTVLIECPVALTGSYVIPAGVTSIEANAFQNSQLTNITIPNTVTSIGGYAFAQSSLSSITINFGVTSIGTNAFYECYDLTNVMIPSSVTNLADYAFQGCTSLLSVDFQGNAPAADCTVFGGDSLTVYYLPGTQGWSNTFACETAVEEASGSVQVSIDPQEVATNGAAWQVDSGPSETNGVTVTNLAVGNHTVTFSAVSGWTTPTTQIVSVSANSTATASGTYVQLPSNSSCYITNAGLSNGLFGFDVIAANNSTVVVSAATNLAPPIWVPLMTNSTLNNGFFYFSDSQWGNFSNRFYILQIP